MVDALWWLLSGSLVVLGLAGTVLPALPGTALVLAGIVLAAWIDNFSRIGWVTLTIVAVLAVISWILDYLAGIMGAKKAGASREAIIGAALGTVAGIFMGLVGVFFMPLVGAVMGEYLAGRSHRRSIHVGVATWIGVVVGMIAKVIIGFVMIGVFAVALLM